MCKGCIDHGAGGVRRVLVIDDEPSVADALRMILEDEGYAVSVAANGREGIEHARRDAFCVTAVVSAAPQLSD